MGSKSTFSAEHVPGRQERAQRTYSLVGPVVLITLGVLFLVGQYVPACGIGKTWPVLLVVIGVTKLIESIFLRTSGRLKKGGSPSLPGDQSR